MTADHLIPFDELSDTDLPTGAILQAGAGGGIGGEPVSVALSVGNQGGIRTRSHSSGLAYIALFSKLDHADWPDTIDRRSGVLTYHGDNLHPQKGALDTKGNRALHGVFRRGFSSEKDRLLSPPLFVLTKAEGPGIESRSVRFEGVAVPGAVTVPDEDWFVAKWYDGSQGRHENYLLTATILDIAHVTRSWLTELQAGISDGPSCPLAYRHWIDSGQRRSAGSVG